MKGIDCGFIKPIKVACGIIWKDNKIFIARRKPHKILAGYWEFPGGKLEHDEKAEKALVRELKEEFDMSIRNPRFFGEHVYGYDFATINLIAYSCEFVNSTFNMTDHDAYEFVLAIELNLYALAPADQYFVKKLI